ncbi:hypothetical protein GCM10027261_18080 [Geodermatophilus arenarius]|uniref:Short chain dehydrogenase n=1 Tax=Geodermatophilus arenarius TaxID=1137990 RepID=A0ABV9LPE7_9ACTN
MRIDLSGRTAVVTGSSRGIVAGRPRPALEGGAGAVHTSPPASATTGGALRVDGGCVDAILP